MGYDSGTLDDYVLTANISSLTSLDVTGKNISDLTGIEVFVNLRTLICQNNNLTELHLNANTLLHTLYCSQNQLTALDVSNNSDLQTLDLGINQINQIDVSNLPFLKILNCSNNQLTQLDLSNNITIQNVYCEYNQITQLDLSNNPLLRYFYCHHNQLTQLDISNKPLLYYVYCNDNNLEQIDVSGDTALNYINCSINQLKQLDFSTCTGLQQFYCNSNEFLASMDLRNGHNDQLSVGWWDNPSLMCIYVDDVASTHWGLPNTYAEYLANESECNLTWVYIPDAYFEQALIGLGLDDVRDSYVLKSNVSGVTTLDLSSKNISDLTGIEAFESLISLDCYNNKITEIDLSANVAIQTFSCTLNQLKELDLSVNRYLVNLTCSGNQLTSLDLRDNVSLHSVNCYNNKLVSLDLRNGNNKYLSTLNINNNPNLTCIYVDDVAFAEAHWALPNPNDHFVADEAECSFVLSSDEFESKQVTLYPNPATTVCTIQLPDSQIPDKILIMDLAGKVVSKYTNINTFNVSRLRGGFYLVRIFAKEKSGLAKLLIE